MKALHEQLLDIFEEVQHNPGCHQRFTQVLSRVYDRTDFEEFVEVFMRFLRILFRAEVNMKNLYHERAMQFSVNFTVKLAQKYGEDEKHDDCHPLLSRIIHEVLKLHNVVNVNKRYHSCKFITVILDAIGERMTLDNELCDDIQNAMLVRINDPKSLIRIMAVQALLRLQMPNLNKCPVTSAFLLALNNDPMYTVRRAVVDKIAPSHLTIPHLVNRTRDVNEKVRAAAFAKCSIIPPNFLRIVQRQTVCFAGFDETCKATQRVFLEVMLPKWLTCYEGNFLKFLSAIRLDADENDVENTTRLSKLIMGEFIRTHPMESVISFLPIDEDKLVPINKLSSEIILYWSILQEHLVNNEDVDEILERILPDLLPFCNYIEKYMTENEVQKLESWKYLQYQFILLNLFNMSGRFDLSDEVGKQRLHQLAVTTLRTKKLEVNLVEQLVVILEKTVFGNLVQLTEDISELISTRETEIEEEPSPEKLHNWNFKLAELKVKLNIASEEVEDAIVARDLKLAAVKEEEFKALRKQVDAWEAQKPGPAKVTRPMSDEMWGHRRLDILNAVLYHPKVLKLTPALRALKDGLVKAMSPPSDMEVYSKLHRCMALTCVIDRKCAEENAKMICTPVASYRLLPEYDKKTLIVSVNTLTDMMRLYGLKIFEEEEDAAAGNVEHQNLRKLYNPTEASTADFIDRKSIEYLVESIVLMLDAECQELRDCASVAISHMLYHGIMISPALLSRIQLKLYNPLTEKDNPKMCQLFGRAMIQFACKVPGSADTVEKSIIPSLTTIGNAPRTSPLADINIDGITRFFSLLTSIESNKIVDTHKSLAYSLCSQISKNIESRCVPVWLKMLLVLNPPRGDRIALKELRTQVLLILQEIKEKSPKERLRKYITNLDSELNSLETAQITEVTDGEDVRSNQVEISFNNQPDAQISDAPHPKKIHIISDIRVPSHANPPVQLSKHPVVRRSSTSTADSGEDAARVVQVIADIHAPPAHVRTPKGASEGVKKRDREIHSDESTSSNLRKKKKASNLQDSSKKCENHKGKSVQKAKKQKLVSSEDELSPPRVCSTPNIKMKKCTVLLPRVVINKKGNKIKSNLDQESDSDVNNSEIIDDDSVINETSYAESLVSRKSARLSLKKAITSKNKESEKSNSENTKEQNASTSKLNVDLESSDKSLRRGGRRKINQHSEINANSDLESSQSSNKSLRRGGRRKINQDSELNANSDLESSQSSKKSLRRGGRRKINQDSELSANSDLETSRSSNKSLSRGGRRKINQDSELNANSDLESSQSSKKSLRRGGRRKVNQDSELSANSDLETSRSSNKSLSRGGRRKINQDSELNANSDLESSQSSNKSLRRGGRRKVNQDSELSANSDLETSRSSNKSLSRGGRRKINQDSELSANSDLESSRSSNKSLRKSGRHKTNRDSDKGKYSELGSLKSLRSGQPKKKPDLDESTSLDVSQSSRRSARLDASQSSNNSRKLPRGRSKSIQSPCNSDSRLLRGRGSINSSEKLANSDTSPSKSSTTSGGSNVAVVGVDRPKLTDTTTKSNKVSPPRRNKMARKAGQKTSDDSDASVPAMKRNLRRNARKTSTSTASDESEKRLRGRQRRGGVKRIKLDSSSVSERSTRSSYTGDLSVISESS